MSSKEEPVDLRSELNSAEEAHGTQSPELVDICERLAYSFHSRGDYESAETYYKRAAAIKEYSRPEERASLIDLYHGLAILMRIQNRFADAETYYLRTIELSKEIFGERHWETATRLNYLAGVYFAWGKFAGAKELVQSSLSIYQETFGEDHQVVGIAAMGLALICNRQGDSAQATEYFRKADRLLPAGPRGVILLDFKDLPASLFFLSKEKYKQGQIEEAETLFRYSVITETERLWPGHRIVGENVQLLADLYRSQYMVSEAEFLYRKALTIRQQVMGEDHLDVAVSAHSLGTLLHDNKRYDEAASFLMEAVKIREKAGFPPLLATSLRAYSATLRQLNRMDEAEESELKARNIFARYNPT